MNDNAPGHAAIVTREMLRELAIEQLPWPPALPDLNPIKNIWQIMKQKLRKYTTAIPIVAELQKAAQKE